MTKFGLFPMLMNEAIHLISRQETSQSVQAEVNKKTSDAIEEKRKALIADAQTAIGEAEKALGALNKNKNKNKNQEALDALAFVEIHIIKSGKVSYLENLIFRGEKAENLNFCGNWSHFRGKTNRKLLIFGIPSLIFRVTLRGQYSVSGNSP